jgi:hypothetical protein
MRASVVPLVVLLCVSGASWAHGDREEGSGVHYESQKTKTSALTDSKTTTQPDIWTELKHLRDVVQNLRTIMVEQWNMVEHGGTELKTLNTGNM